MPFALNWKSNEGEVREISGWAFPTPTFLCPPSLFTLPSLCVGYLCLASRHDAPQARMSIKSRRLLIRARG